MSSGEGEEIAISVRWRRPGVRAARRMVGIAAVTIGAMQLWGAEPVARRDEEMSPTLDWSCDRMPAPQVHRMTDTPNADDGRNDEKGADDSAGNRNDVVLLEEHVTRRIIGV